MSKMGMKPGTMSDDHKAKLRDGRYQAKIVRDYLTHIKQHKPKRGRKRTSENVRSELAAIKAKLELGNFSSPVEELKAVQAQLRLTDELYALQCISNASVDVEESFIEVAFNYSKRHGISRAAWIKLGVSAEVLRKAGIK